MDFNTLDAQREAAEFTIRGMRGEGWITLPTRYDDGGYSGASVERPAMQRLLFDIESGLVDCVVVYKVDRLSRSLTDFAKLLALFDENGVTFVSTTQSFNTTDSMGRLTLNILLSFAQFEREMIVERTRDKMAAARKKGKWLGSPPPYGYDGDRERMRLLINEEEAERLRIIFNLYLRYQVTSVVAEKLNERGWHRKLHITKAGKQRGGKRWTGRTVLDSLRDPIYIGKVRYKEEIYEGEQEALVDEEVFRRVQTILDRKSCGRGKRRSRNPEYLLSGLIQCGRCGSRFTTSAGHGRKGRLYRYYLCSRHGRSEQGCDHPRLSGPELEVVVIEQLREFCADEGLREELISKVKSEETETIKQLNAEQTELEGRISKLNEEDDSLMEALREQNGRGHSLVIKRAGEIEEQRDRLHTLLSIVHGRLHAITDARTQIVTGVAILAAFDQAWDAMTIDERQDLVHLLVERVIIDEPEGRLEVHFHDLGGVIDEITQ